MLDLAYIVYPHLEPVIFHIGRFSVRWYGLAYLAGFIVAYLWLRVMTRSGKLRISLDQLNDAMSWLIVGTIAGGRLGWWFFYHRKNMEGGKPLPWWEPIAVWHGGMAFHGAIIGVTVAMILWAWFARASLRNLADCSALVTPVGLFFGRIANFINAELVGRPTTVPWGVIFPHDTVSRHPSQLYEAILEGPVLLMCLWAVHKWGKPAEGRVAAVFVMLYALFRFLVEFTREPDTQIGYLFWHLTMGQLLSAAMFLAGLILWGIWGKGGKADLKFEI